jgi:hypothetical protein
MQYNRVRKAFRGEPPPGQPVQGRRRRSEAPKRCAFFSFRRANAGRCTAGRGCAPTTSRRLRASAPPSPTSSSRMPGRPYSLRPICRSAGRSGRCPHPSALRQPRSSVEPSAAGRVFSLKEREALLRIAPGARVTVSENGVDTRFYQEMGDCSCDRPRILFVGHMAHHANIGAATRFVLWPRIRERFPSWMLTVAGSSPPPSALALGSERTVEVTGTVPDLRPSSGQAVAAIIPLRVRGGTRLKILEAMAVACPRSRRQSDPKAWL